LSFDSSKSSKEACSLAKLVIDYESPLPEIMNLRLNSTSFYQKSLNFTTKTQTFPIQNNTYQNEESPLASMVYVEFKATPMIIKERTDIMGFMGSPVYNRKTVFEIEEVSHMMQN